MELKQLTIENFGPHRQKRVSLSSPVSGVTGPNGSGKSNILQALRFALTGTLPANKEDVIYRFGAPDGAKSASVWLYFTANGKDYAIHREINAKTSKVKLICGQEAIVNRVEVQQRMEEMLGADKAALNSAVFIGQGEIDRLVRGTPAERQTLFFKILNLGYLEKRAEKAAEGAKLLLTGVEDLTPLLEALKADEQTIKSDLEEARKLLDATPDKAEALAKAHRELQLRNKADAAGAHIDRMHADLRDIEAAVRQTATQYGLAEDTSVDGLEDAFACLRNKYASKQELLEAEKCRAEKHESILSRKMELDTYSARLLQDISKLAGEYGIPEDADPDKLAEIHGKWEQYDIATARIGGIKTELATNLEKKNEALTKRTELLEAVSRNKELRKRKEAEAKSLEEAAQRAVADAENACWRRDTLLGWRDGNNVTCPICGGPAHTPTAEEKEQAEQRVTELSIVRDKAKTEWKRADGEVHALILAIHRDETEEAYLASTIDGYGDEMNRLAKELTEWNVKLAGLGGFTPEALPYTKNNLMLFLATRNQRKFALEECTAQLEHIAAALASVEDPPRPSSEIQADLEETRNKSEALSTDARLLDIRKRQIVAYKSRIKEAEADIAAVSGSNIPDASVIQERIDELQQRMAERQALQLKCTQLEEYAEAKRKRIADVQAKAEKDAERVRRARVLERVKEELSRPNIPMAFAGKVFEEVTSSVNALLAQMGANFYVTPDPVEPITFRFIRTEDTDAVQMRQERLSGGQSIRLALALLISVQKLLMSNVGLLVLDEPSSHIDAEGIESMAQLFRTLTGALSAARMQIIVVDHSPVLAASFGCTTAL